MTQRFDSHAALCLLRAKYTALVELREQRARDPDAPAPRAALRLLARRFPGALRELELRPMEDLRARARSLSAAVDQQGPIPEWAPMQVAFHGVLRAILEAKGAMVGTAEPLAAGMAILLALPAEPDTPAASFWTSARCAAIAKPPDGRPSSLAISWVAELFGIPAADVHVAVSPAGTPCEL